MSKLHISICIPAYNAINYVNVALESVRGQTYSDWELIVIEDGSSDGTEQIVESFSKTVSQPVRYCRSEVNRGLPATRNASIVVASGSHIALLDADDYWAPEHLVDLVKLVAVSGAEVAHSGSILFKSTSGEVIEVRAPTPEVLSNFPISLFLADYIIQPASVLLSKAIWSRVGGFDESFRYVEDREMWMRCARAGAGFAFTGRNTCYYRRHANALSTHSIEMAIANARVFEQHIDWGAIPKVIRMHSIVNAWTAGARILQRSEPARASKLLLCAQRIAPRWARYQWFLALRLYSMLKGK